MAADVVVRLVHIAPNSMLQLYVLDLVGSLSPLLCCHQVEVCLPGATALNTILLSFREMKEKVVWKILEETKVVVSIVGRLRDFSDATIPSECFQEMAPLLSTILLRWPQSRYYVWNNSELMVILEGISQKPDVGLRVAALKLYSAVALCGHGAKKLLENGKHMLDVMISCMDKLSPQNARTEGFKLAQRLATGKQECLRMIGMCCEPLVKIIVQGMNRCSLTSGKLANDQISLLMEACKLALITRWEGKHHIYFWKNGIAHVLLSLVMENFHGQRLSSSMSLEEQISIAEEVLNENFLPSLRSYIWDIIGFLAIHCEEEFTPVLLGDEFRLNFLVTCACLTFSRSVQRGYQICQNDMISASQSESAARATLMMIYSSCKYVSSKARVVLSVILEKCGGQHVKSLLNFLSYTASGKSHILPHILQTAVCLVGLACYSCIPQYASVVIENQGIEISLSFCSWYLRNRDNIGPSSFAPHLQSIVEKSTCCWACAEDWDNKDTLLLYSLWAVAEMLYHSGYEQNHLEEFFTKRKSVKDQLCATLEEIRDGIYGLGPRWYSAHILSYFGCYGFRSKLGKRLMRAFNDEACSDMLLVFASEKNVSVHRVILAVRCPSLLPPEMGALSRSSITSDKPLGIVQEIRMSSNVDSQALVKLLEFAYSGYVEVENTLSKKLRTLARHCNSQILLHMLSRRRPKWGSSIPRLDLRLALNATFLHLSDVILEPKEVDIPGWNCRFCSSTFPHVHAHRVILWSSCEYLRALFQSGMQESHSDRLSVPVGWLALTKLLSWFYADELSNPPSGCVWDNMNNEEKLHELRPYVEMYSLAEFWILEDLQEDCARVIESCLKSAKELWIRIMEIAANLSQWKLAEAAADHAAPIYHKLRDSGELDEIDEELVNMIRAASVRFSQCGNMT
ncbi:PREDICTED: BTB/POZ domain-containing protein At1g04390 isoform X2 [Tarenaya hassleriana]|nr:PREDICTED: BTB/POZ domain-containing protein At1g04390 isoform X2 [Tarenaya hassleriana]